MANRAARRAMPKPQLTPEEQHRIEVEKQMEKFIEDEGMEAMIEKQIGWKVNDVKLKLAAASNIKAWFETRGELIDVINKEDVTLGRISELNDFKTYLYEQIINIYEEIKPEIFSADTFVNPFIELWETYENHRESMDAALHELYAWVICEDPVMWARDMYTLVSQYDAKEFVEEDAD